MSRAEFDVAVVGGGPAGLTTALCLARRGWSVLVIESTQHGHPRVGEHLTPDGIATLHSLGLQHLARDEEHAPCSRIRSFWGNSAGVIHDYFYCPFDGLNLDRLVFDRALAEAARGEGVTILEDTVARVAQGSGRALLDLYKQRVLQHRVAARFLIDATGRAASIAAQCGARRRMEDRLVGVVVRPTSKRGHDASHMDCLLLEPTDAGWWYAARLAYGQNVLMFMTDADILHSAESALSFARDRLRSTSYLRTAWDAGEWESVLVRPAHSQTLAPVHGSYWVAVGDAAWACDPLSSQGISKALSWGRRCSTAVDGYLHGDEQSLPTYQQQLADANREYMQMRRDLYCRETRWPNAPFWSRRHAEITARQAKPHAVESRG